VKFRWEALAAWTALTMVACGEMPAMPGAAPTSAALPPGPPSSSPESIWPSAKQLPLDEARVPFATYVNMVHGRLHPHFADGFLTSLDTLPTSDPRNALTLSTELAFAIDGKTGRLDNVKVTRSSGVPQFDAGALNAMKRAFPTVPPDPAIWSTDRKVYALWEFHRGPEACGTWNARPFKFAF
jgi:TonB family protein